MKIQPDRPQEGLNVISRLLPDEIGVNADLYRQSILIPWQGTVQPWNCERFEDLTVEHFVQVASLNPELVLFGSGQRIRFLKPKILRVLIDRGIGVETMDVAAACRTFNVLVAEGRPAVVALLMERTAAGNTLDAS
jgi:uncharacterized protein